MMHRLQLKRAYEPASLRQAHRSGAGHPELWGQGPEHNNAVALADFIEREV